MAQQAVYVENGLNYLLHVPSAVVARPCPLLVFLHGAGQRGADLAQVKELALPRTLDDTPDFPFIVLSPQCPENSWWTFHITQVHDLVTQIIATQPIDPARLYLTGMSMGGHGAWTYAIDYPDLFAAAVIICAPNVYEPKRLCNLKRMPIWLFHGAQDPVVPLSCSEVMLEGLLACDADVRLTVYPAALHDSWTQTYANTDVYAWLLSHSKA
jgi:predicted peptidase